MSAITWAQTTVSKNGIEMGWFSHTSDRFLFLFLFFALHRYRDGQHSEVYPVQIFSKTPPGLHTDTQLLLFSTN